MSMTVPVPSRHEHALPDPKDLADGTCMNCATCGRWMHAEYDYNPSGWGGMYWVPVRWFNFILRRRIRQALALNEERQ